MYINEAEVSQILGYKNVKSYRNSKKNREGVNKLINILSKRIEDVYKNEINNFKRDIIIYIKEK